MTQPKMTLWQIIDALTQQIPFTRAKVEKVLVTQLEKEDTSQDQVQNTVFRFTQAVHSN